MALATSLDYEATSLYDAIDEIKDTAVSGGWTLHDTLSSPYGYVLSSTGENSDQPTCYARIFYGTTYGANISMYTYYYWNATTHVGSYYAGSSSYSHVFMDFDDGGTIWISANKDSIGYVVFDGVRGRYDFGYMGLIEPFVEGPLGITTGAVSSGSNVVIQLGSGEADGFVAGYDYQFMCNEYRQKVTVNSVNTSSDQLTITTLSYNFSSGARIGTNPHNWLNNHSILGTQFAPCFFQFDKNGTANDNQAYNSGVFLFSTSISPDYRTQMYVTLPYVFIDPYYGYKGMDAASSLIQYCLIGYTSENYAVEGVDDTGTSSGSNTSTTLNDTTKAWTTNQWADYIIMLSDGTGVKQYRTISSNTSTAITISSAWTTTPDATSVYLIGSEVWESFFTGGNQQCSCAIRIA